MTETPSLLIHATYRLPPDQAETFRSIAARMAAAARARDGGIFLDVARDIADPALFRLSEGWRDRAALDAHLAGTAFQAALEEVAALTIVASSADLYHVSASDTLALPAGT